MLPESPLCRITCLLVLQVMPKAAKLTCKGTSVGAKCPGSVASGVATCRLVRAYAGIRSKPVVMACGRG